MIGVQLCFRLGIMEGGLLPTHHTIFTNTIAFLCRILYQLPSTITVITFTIDTKFSPTDDAMMKEWRSHHDKAQEMWQMLDEALSLSHFDNLECVQCFAPGGGPLHDEVRTVLECNLPSLVSRKILYVERPLSWVQRMGLA